MQQEQEAERERKTILVVDDEPSIQMLFKRILKTRGRRTRTESDGRRALDYYRCNHDHIAMIFCDVTMPGLSGLEFAREALAVDPLSVVVLMSGKYQALPASLASRPTIFFLAKPLEKSSILAALAEAELAVR